MAFETGLTAGERLTSLFQPDTLIPDQYLETFKRLTHLQPEKRLMLALLNDGIACFQKYVTARDGRGKRIFKETEEWVLEEPNERVFCFDNVCETLGLDANYLRQGLMRWKATHTENPAPARVYQLLAPVADDGKCAAEAPTMEPELRRTAVS